MIRSILILGAALSIAGAAQAQSVKVSLAGKSHGQAREELYQAAVQSCRADASIMDNVDDCVSSTYGDALAKARTFWRAAPRPSRVASR